MKKLFLLTILLTILALSGKAQDVSIPLEDLKQLRKVAAESAFYKQSFEEAQKQSAEWQAQSNRWRDLYESEKVRADNIQGGRIKELTDANTELGKANFQYKQQSEADRVKIGEVTAENIRLRSERKYVFALGAGLGFAAGTYTGYQVSKIGAFGSSANRNPFEQQNRNQFSLKFKF